MRSTKSRIRAAITAGFALSAAGLLAATGGTVAQVSNTITAKVHLAVEGTPYGIARGVSAAFHYEAVSGSPNNADQRDSSVNSLTAPDRTNPTNFSTPYDYAGSNNSGLRLLAAPNVTSCASSSREGNTSRCPVDALPTESIVSASSGNDPAISKTDIDFRDNQNRWLAGANYTDLRIHDMWTSVSCTANGAYAAAPKANINFGGSESNALPRHRKRTGWMALPSANHYRTIQQWASQDWNNAQTVEVQSIKKTFQNPTRAVSAIVVYATSSDGTNPISDFSFVAKSECAISEDGTVELSDSSTFGPITPGLKSLDTPAWVGNYTRTLATGEVTDFSHVANVSSTLGRSAQNRQATDEANGRRQSLMEESTAEQDDLTNSETLATNDDAIIPPPSTPFASAPTTVSAPANTSPTPKATQPTTSGGPTPGTTQRATSGGPTPSTIASTSEPATAGYTTAAGQSYASATGAALTRSQRELVEEAIAAAQTTESGELADGVTFATTSNQLDGATLIVTTADGGTLRIVWEK